MSGGRKFSSDTVLSAEERLDEIERKYSVIQERIQSYDRILVEYEVLKKESKQLKDYCNYLEKLTEKESQNLLGLITKFSNNLEEVKKSNESNREIINQFGTNHVLQVNRINEDINSHRLDLKSVSKESEEQKKRTDVLSKALSLLNSDLKNTKGRIEDFSASVDVLNSNHSSLKKELSKTQERSNNDMGRFIEAIQKIPNFKDWASQILVRSDAGLQDLRAELSNKIHYTVENVRTELKEDPLTVDFIKKEFKNALESLALDSKNAYLKSNNCAQQIQLLEKKIENINLNLKKYELSK